MGVWTKVYGGAVVKRAVERYHASAKDAREYLEIFGIDKKVRGTHFEHDCWVFSLSHPIEDIRTNDTLPDNAMSNAMRPREKKPKFTINHTTPKKMAQEDEASLIEDFLSKKSKGDDKNDEPERKSKPGGGIKRPVINGKVVVLKEICRDLKMEPRVARVILRKKLKDRDPNSRWEWPAGEAEKIKEILKAGA